MRPFKQLSKSRKWEGQAFVYSYGDNTEQDAEPAPTEEELIVHVRHGARVRMCSVEGPRREGLYNLLKPNNLIESWIDDEQLYPR